MKKTLLLSLIYLSFAFKMSEMAIKNSNIENAIIESNKGLVCVEAENISPKNMTFLTTDKTIMQVQNSKNVVLNNIQCGSNKDVLLKIMGDKSAGIKPLNTETQKVKKAIELGIGVLCAILQKYPITTYFDKTK